MVPCSFSSLTNEGIDRFVGHAMNEEIGSFLNRGAGRFQLGRMHRNKGDDAA